MVSQHLSELRLARLVQVRRKGTFAYYSAGRITYSACWPKPLLHGPTRPDDFPLSLGRRRHDPSWIYKSATDGVPVVGSGAVRSVWVFEGELAGIGVEVEQLAVAAPVDRDLELLAGFVLGEASAQQVEEESFAQVAVFGVRRAL